MMSADYPKRELSRVFNIPRSTYHSYQRRKNTVNVDQERLKAKVISLHRASRQAAGSRTLTSQLKQQGEQVGRYKVKSLMKATHLSSKQPGKHRYKSATKPSDIAENLSQSTIYDRST
jgi:putative transposase